MSDGGSRLQGGGKDEFDDKKWGSFSCLFRVPGKKAEMNARNKRKSLTLHNQQGQGQEGNCLKGANTVLKNRKKLAHFPRTREREPHARE